MNGVYVVHQVHPGLPPFTLTLIKHTLKKRDAVSTGFYLHVYIGVVLPIKKKQNKKNPFTATF